MKNKGWLYKRCETNPREKAFAEVWERENNHEVASCVNHGYGALQDLFIKGVPAGIDFFAERKLVTRITRRDRFIVATVIQWFGTNCGMGFLHEALRACGYEIVKKNEGVNP